MFADAEEDYSQLRQPELEPQQEPRVEIQNPHSDLGGARAHQYHRAAQVRGPYGLMQKKMAVNPSRA